MPSQSQSSSTKNNNEEVNKRVKVAVIGAGAAGLMCANELLMVSNGDDGDGDGDGSPVSIDLEDIVILEARDRIGGRIHTTVETVTPIDDDDDGAPVTVYRDHGAAWVHGTSSDWPDYYHSPSQPQSKEEDDDKDPVVANPMMKLLQQVTPPGENVCLTHLEPTFPLGNPWMRPGHVCIGPKQLVLFVDGVQIGGHDGNCNENGNDTERVKKGRCQHGFLTSSERALHHHGPSWAHWL